MLERDEATITPEFIINQMARKNISCRFGIPPLHREPYFSKSDFSDSSFPVSCMVAEKTFFIPIYPGLSEESQAYIIASLKEALHAYKSIKR